ETTVEFSTRMTRSLGRCYPRRCLIRIAARLRNEPPANLDEVLCHEAAHLAAFRLYGPGAKPHGREWQDLVKKAGFPPSARMRVDASSSLAPRRRNTVHYEHRCPVCQASRAARRPMRRWRCASCRDAGLEGLLEIRSWPAPAEVQP
ncbi:MAG: SprT-like domain-containing protein, partial [Thermoanaerobaculia bacterium]